MVSARLRVWLSTFAGGRPSPWGATSRLAIESGMTPQTTMAGRGVRVPDGDEVVNDAQVAEHHEHRRGNALSRAVVAESAAGELDLGGERVR
jgi:hypothetical protein